MKQFVLALAGIAALTAVGCGSTTKTSGRDTQTGTIQAPLTAIGPDGATYAVPTTASLVIGQAGSTAPTCEAISSAPTQTTSLLAGTYTVFLSTNGCVPSMPADAGTNVPFTLNRAADGGSTTANALLLNPEQTVTVTAGSSNSLVFHFALEQVGVVTMTTGNVTTSITTDAAVVTTAAVAGSLVDSYVSVTYTPAPGEAADAGLNALFVSMTQNSSFTVSMTNLSAFSAGTDSTCAIFTPVVSTAFPALDMAALAQEFSAPGAAGEVCFWDATSAYPNMVDVSFSRSGPVVSSMFRNALPGPDGGVASVTFMAEFDGYAASGTYNGLTLNLPAFASPAPLTVTAPSGGVLTMTLPGTGGTAEVAFTGTNTQTLQFIP